MLNRRIRNLALSVLPMAALLGGSVLNAGSASASPANPPCSPPGACFFQNLYSSGSNHGLFALGQGHNQDIVSNWTTGSLWSYTGKSGVWGIIQNDDGGPVQGECWNTNGTAIGLDSCPSGDTNEYFDFVIHGNYWLIESYRTGEYVATDHSGQNLYFTPYVNDTSLWSLP
jgi:hypothetical protein